MHDVQRVFVNLGHRSKTAKSNRSEQLDRRIHFEHVHPFNNGYNEFAQRHHAYGASPKGWAYVRWTFNFNFLTLEERIHTRCTGVGTLQFKAWLSRKKEEDRGRIVVHVRSEC